MTSAPLKRLPLMFAARVLDADRTLVRGARQYELGMQHAKKAGLRVVPQFERPGFSLQPMPGVGEYSTGVRGPLARYHARAAERLLWKARITIEGPPSSPYLSRGQVDRSASTKLNVLSWESRRLPQGTAPALDDPFRDPSANGVTHTLNSASWVDETFVAGTSNEARFGAISAARTELAPLRARAQQVVAPVAIGTAAVAAAGVGAGALYVNSSSSR